MLRGQEEGSRGGGVHRQRVTLSRGGGWGVMASHARQCQHPFCPMALATLPTQPCGTSVGEEGDVYPLCLSHSTLMLF